MRVARSSKPSTSRRALAPRGEADTDRSSRPSAARRCPPPSPPQPRFGRGPSRTSMMPGGSLMMLRTSSRRRVREEGRRRRREWRRRRSRRMTGRCAPMRRRDGARAERPAEPGACRDSSWHDEGPTPAPRACRRALLPMPAPPAAMPVAEAIAQAIAEQIIDAIPPMSLRRWRLRLWLSRTRRPVGAPPMVQRFERTVGGERSFMRSALLRSSTCYGCVTSGPNRGSAAQSRGDDTRSRPQCVYERHDGTTRGRRKIGATMTFVILREGEEQSEEGKRAPL